MDYLKRLENELKNCVKCGACRAHCPVFSAVGREPVSARGKIALARAALSGQLSLDARTREVLSKCLLCGRCVEKCANDVPTDLIVLAAREALARKRGTTFFNRLVGFLLRNRALLSGGAALATLFGPLLFRKVPASSGLRLRFPLPYVGGQRHFPKIAAKPFSGKASRDYSGCAGKATDNLFRWLYDEFYLSGDRRSCRCASEKSWLYHYYSKKSALLRIPCPFRRGPGDLSGTGGKESCRTGSPPGRLRHDGLCFLRWGISSNVSLVLGERYPDLAVRCKHFRRRLLMLPSFCRNSDLTRTEVPTR